MSDRVERLPSGTMILRDRRIASASEGVALLTGRPVPELLGRPLTDLLAEEDRARIADRHERALRGEPVPTEYETTLVRADGARRTVECHVGLDGGDVVLHVRDVTADMERRPRLEALAALGAAIQRERTEEAVLARIRGDLAPLPAVALLMRAEPEGVRVEWAQLPAELDASFAERLGRPLAGYVGRWTPFSRAVWSDGAAYSDDWGAEAAAFLPDAVADLARGRATSAGLSRAIAVRVDERPGVRYYLVLVEPWLRAEDVPAIRLFGAQVAAALDAARTIADLSRRNADLSALNRIAGLASDTTDLRAFFAQTEAILREAAGCAELAIFVLDDADSVLLRVHDDGGAPEALRARFARVPLASSLGDVVRERVARLVTSDEAGETGEALARPPFRTSAWVPLVARSRVVGVMVARFPGEPDAVRPRLDLLVAAGAHLAGAIESHGLLADLRRRVSELTLLNDVALASGQLDPVLLLDNALRRVCDTFQGDAGAAYLRDGDRLVLVAAFGMGVDTARRFAQLGVGEGLPGLAVQRLAPVQGDAAGFDPPSAAFADAEGLRSAVAVPLLAKGQAAVGAIVFGRREPRATSDGELTLLSAVGVQLGVAVENARLFADVSRRLSDLEAIHALALRIFGNAPGDVQGLLDDGCREAARALRCRAAVVLLASDDAPTARLRGVAAWGSPLDPSRIDLPLAQDKLSEDAIRRRAPAWSADVTKDPRSAMCGNARVPPLAMLVVPLTSRTATRGVLFLAADAGRAFTDAELALANALAGELAVGLENAELYAEARERLSELSTVIDVARVVSSSLELEEVLALGAQHLKRTLAGSACTILLDDVRRAELRRAASSGPPIGPPAIPLSGASLAREALDARAPVTGRAPTAAGAADPALLAVPLHVRDQPVGVALVTAAEPERTFTPGELSRAMAIASQLAVAVDNARLYSETRRRAEELGLLHEVGRSLVATLDIEGVLDAGVRNLARMVDAPVAVLALLREDGAQLEVRAVWGATPEQLGRRHPLHSAGARLASLVHDRREPIVIEDAATDPRVRDDLAREPGARALLGLPLLVRDRFVGTAVIVETRGPRRFSAAEVERAAAIANQLAVAAENARLYEDLRRSYAELAHAQRQLIHQERLAALGELSAVVAHEVRNPLGVIFNSLGSLRRLLRPHGDAKMLLDIVGEEADRLNRIVGDLLDFARPSTPLVRPEPLERVVDEAVAAALAQSSTSVEVHRVPGDLPLVPVDARLVRQAVLNVAVNAVQAMPRGGTLTVRTRREERSALVELEDTGAGIPEEVRGRIFEPFFTTKASGTGLGLAVVKRIVEGHGGELSVRSRPGAGTVFSLRFPLTPPAGVLGTVEIEAENG